MIAFVNSDWFFQVTWAKLRKGFKLREIVRETSSLLYVIHETEFILKFQKLGVLGFWG